VNDDIRAGADGLGGDRRITQVADHRPDAGPCQFLLVHHRDVGTQFEQRRDDAPSDEAGAAGHHYPGLLLSPHGFSIHDA
jgi:hypothetical protein